MSETKTLDLSQFESPDKDMPNVKELWSPKLEQEDEDEILFDLERDITEADWEKMFIQLEDDRKNDKWGSFPSHASNMKILDPNRDLGLTKDDWKEMISHLDHDRTTGCFYNEVRKMKILDPKRNLGVTRNDWDGMEKELNEYRKNKKDWGVFASIAISMKILDPNKNLLLTKKDWDGMIRQLQIFRECEFDQEVGIAVQTMRMKILDPNRDLGLTKDDWKEMKKELDILRIRNDNWGRFSWLSANMKILAAKKVEVTDQGLKLTMPEKKPQIPKTPPLPTKLNFN